MGDNSASTGKVVDLTAARAAAGKKEQPTVEDAAPKGRTAKGAKADKPPVKDKAPTKGAPSASRRARRPKKGKTAPIKEAAPRGWRL